MLLALRMRIFLAISFFIYGTNSQACPQWVTSMLEVTLANHTTWPGIQLTLSSPHCGLNCTTSVQSKASDFAGEPALFDDTPWRLASITKTFTAVAILKLVERAQLDLYAPAVQYLPGWAVDLLQQSQGAINAEQITTWHLLHHTSGLGDFATDPRWMQEVLSMPQHMWTQRSVIEWSTVNSTPVGSPGEVFHYTDTGYTLLGLILENVTRTDLAAAVRDLAGLDELNMLSTWWELLEPQPEDSLQRAGQYHDTIDVTRTNLAAAVRDLAGLDELNMLSTWWELLEPQPEGSLQRAGQYHDTIDVTHFNPSFDLYGAGGLVSDSKDLNHFGRALYEGRVLDETTTQLMYVLEPSGTYGCGVVNYSLGGQQAWGHTGFWHTWLYWVPSLDLVISGASNQAVGDLLDTDKLVRNVIDHGCTPV